MELAGTLFACGGNLESKSSNGTVGSSSTAENSNSGSSTQPPTTAPVNPPVVTNPPVIPPVVGPPPVNPPTPSGGYKVYTGCTSPSTNFSRTIYVNGVSGSDLGNGSLNSPYKTISNLISKKLILGGDHIVIEKGTYAPLDITNSNSVSLVGNTKWVWFDFQTGADLQGLNIQNVSQILVTGANIYKSTGQIVNLVGTQNTVISDNVIYSTTANPNSLTAQQWMALASGAMIRNGSCNSFSNNNIRNVRMGITFIADPKTYPANSLKALAE